MKSAILALYVKGQTLWQAIKDESGQDLIEYALLASLIALAATVGMKTIASDINAVFLRIGSELSSDVT